MSPHDGAAKSSRQGQFLTRNSDALAGPRHIASDTGSREPWPEQQPPDPVRAVRHRGQRPAHDQDDDRRNRNLEPPWGVVAEPEREGCERTQCEEATGPYRTSASRTCCITGLLSLNNGARSSSAFGTRPLWHPLDGTWPVADLPLRTVPREELAFFDRTTIIRRGSADAGRVLLGGRTGSIEFGWPLRRRSTP